ncbi:MAG: glycosyltransferase [Thiohalomonadaceae bacterium]
MSKLPLRARINAYWGELRMAVLWLMQPVCRSLGLRFLYRKLLVRLVRGTGLFERNHYLETNGDVAEQSMRPLFHYVAWGDREGRSPMALFDPGAYRQNAKARLARVNTLLHYAWVGRFRRLAPGPWFDTDYYLSNNKDVARAGLDPLLHFVRWGGTEGRSPSPSFDSVHYLRSNRDVAEARLNPLVHYLQCGRFEGRTPLPCESGAEAGGAARDPVPPLPATAWCGVAPRAGGDTVRVDVIVPVYKGRNETLRCLHSVLAAHCDVPFELVVINDASPDAELTQELDLLAERKLFTLLTNEQNCGFVRTVNRGMALHRARDVVLLNADTEVYDGWLDRLRAAAQRNARTGTVTPLSNNATICSYPLFMQDNPFPLEIGFAELDGMAARENAGMQVEAPTAVGFCMYIKRSCLNELGLFDAEAFGKGYGEENDFCRRALLNGWYNLIAADVFVRHWGATSFQGEKARLERNGLQVLARRYPSYQSEVADFITRDPLAEARRNLDWARLRQWRRQNNVLLVTHGRGGGVERHVQQQLAELESMGMGTFVLRPKKGDPHRLIIEHPRIKNLPNLPVLQWQDHDRIRQALSQLEITAVQVHSFVDMVQDAPARMERLARALHARWEVHLHDYYAICPRVSLADEHGRYCGEPAPSACDECLTVRGSDPGVTNITAWRSLHEQTLRSAERVVVPDSDVAQRIGRYYHGLILHVRPHEACLVPRAPRRRVASGGRPRVVVIGAIGKLKGYDVLLASAQHAKATGQAIDFMLMGYSMNDRALEDVGVTITGKYQEQDGPATLHRLDPDLVWLPSVVPETYSYTLSIALQSGVPVVAFEMGAIASRLRSSGTRHRLLPLALAENPERINASLIDFRRVQEEPPCLQAAAMVS